MIVPKDGFLIEPCKFIFDWYPMFEIFHLIVHPKYKYPFEEPWHLNVYESAS